MAPATLQLESQPVDLQSGLLATLPATYTSILPPRPAIDGGALMALTVARDQPLPAPGPASADDRLFSTFAYTGNGAGGVEDKLAAGMLAYTDDALLYLNSFPESLQGARVIRTANSDSAYWANDYIVATAARKLEVFIARDPQVPPPDWLKLWQAAKGKVAVNGREFPLWSLRLKKDDVLRIPGNTDQGVSVKSGLNFILFARLGG